MSASKNKRYFPVLTGIRAFLAWDVFLFHFAEPTASQVLRYNFVTGGGEVGVSLFFVLSGLLIAWQYSDRSFTPKGSLSNYFFRRWSRIYPLFFFISVISLIILSFKKDGPPQTPYNLFLHFTLLKGFFQDRIFLFIGPAWSLTVEECFYALAPLLFMLRRKVGLLIQCIGIAVLGMLLVYLAQKRGCADFMHQYNFMFYWTFFGRAFQFCCGIWLALLLQKQSILVRRFPMFTILGLVAIVTVQMSFVALHRIPLLGSPDMLAIICNNVVVPIAGSLLLYGLITEQSPIRSLLETPIFQFLGKCSFAFYLVHLSPLIREPYHYFHWHPLVVFAAAQTLAIAFYLLLEHPTHRYLNQWWNKNSGV